MPINSQFCEKRLLEYLKMNWFTQVKKNDLFDIFSSAFPQSKVKIICYKILKSKYNDVDNLIKNLNVKLDKFNLHSAAYEKVDSQIDNTKIDKHFVENEYWSDNTKHTSEIKHTSSSDLGILYYAKIVWLTIVAIFLIIVFWKVIRYIFSFLYDVFNKHRMVYMKVIMPRLDTKLDREREKDIAKDMKEKIWRMAQVYRGIHKIGSLSVMDNVLTFFFDKAKFDLAYYYKDGSLFFIVGTYPEYQKVIESNISAQYPDCIIEQIEDFEPLSYKHKYISVMPMKTIKNNVFPIRTFKQLEDDPINNILDSISKISNEDQVTILMSLRPYKDKFNKLAKQMADKLYKREITYDQKFSIKDVILKPLSFIINGPSDKMIKHMKPWASEWDAFIRMTKAEEEAINTMAEEAWKPAFSSSLFLVSCSNYKDRNDENINALISAYTVYKDEYNNELDQPEVMADLFWWFFEPLWKFAVSFSLIGFFTKTNVFTINELASLFHFPDGVFNRSPAIVRADYKMCEPPKNLPVPKEENWRVITGIIAESYKWWDLSKIFKNSRHPNIWQKLVEKVIKDEKTWEEKVITERKTGIKLYKDWVLLGISVYKNQYKPVFIKRNDRTRHHYIIGKSGWGKSVFISFLARQDIWNWDGLCVIDPHWDLVEDIIKYVPKERAKDVIYFDAWNAERPMWLNLYDIDSPNQADRVVNDATEIFLKMFGPEIFGPRIQEYFKYGSLTLLEDLEEWATLLDVPRLFTDDAYREYKVAKVKNPTVRAFWEKTYNAMGEREKQEIIPYFTSKFVSFNTNSLIRNIIGQTKSAFKFREAMDSQKIILINLSKGRIWELNAQLLWMIIVSQIYNAAMSRADIPEEERKDFYLYVDEFQNFVSWTFADILSEARKYRLALIMAHQYIAQLEWWAWNNIWEKSGGKNSVKDAVFGNTWTIQSFKVGAPDAEFLEKEYAPVLSAQDIVWIANYKAYLKLNINNATSRVFNISTIRSKDYENPKIWEILKEYSAKKYWRDVKFVNEEIVARLGMADIDDEDEDFEDID